MSGRILCILIKALEAIRLPVNDEEYNDDFWSADTDWEDQDIRSWTC